MRAAFTVCEITIALCVLSILSAIAMPGLGRLLDRIEVRSAAEDVVSIFSAARHIAIARGAQSTVDVDASSRSMQISVGDTIVRKRDIGAAHRVELAATRARMSYAPTGIGYGAANLSVVVRRNGFADTVFVSRLGRVRH